MKRRLPIFALFALGVASASARGLGLGIDAFNRAIPASASGAAVFSPSSFEVDCVVFAEAVDSIRRAVFANALHVTDQFEEEYRPVAREPFECRGTNGVDLVWARALVVEEPWKVDPAFRLGVQELYGAEVCRAKPARGIEAWIRTLFAGDYDGWRLPTLPKGGHYAFHDLVSVTAEAARTNGWKRLCPTHTVYRQPLVGGADFYAIVPKAGRPVSSVRARFSSVNVQEILSMSKAVIDPPQPVRLALPSFGAVTTNDLAGAFTYFHFPTGALKPLPPGLKPALLRQTARFRLIAPKAGPDAEPLDGPFVFFIHAPALNTIPVAGICPRKGDRP